MDGKWKEMEKAVGICNPRNVYQLLMSTGPQKPDLHEVITESTVHWFTLRGAYWSGGQNTLGSSLADQLKQWTIQLCLWMKQYKLLSEMEILKRFL